MKITKLETFLVKPRWLFLKIHTDEGLVGFHVDREPAGDLIRNANRRWSFSEDHLDPFLRIKYRLIRMSFSYQNVLPS